MYRDNIVAFIFLTWKRQNRKRILKRKNQYPISPINIPQPPPPRLDHHGVPQYKEEVSAVVDKETKDKVEELKRQLKQIKGKD